MIHIAHYHNLTWRRRERLHLPELRDPNDLPRPVGEGANQVKTEENEENFQAEERIRKRIEEKKVSEDDGNPYRNGKQSSSRSRDSGNFHRNSGLDSVDGTTPSSSIVADPLSPDSSERNSSSGLVPLSRLDTQSTESNSEDEGNSTLNSSNEVNKKSKKHHHHRHHKHPNLIVPPLAREDAIRAAEIDKAKKEEIERRQKEKEASKESKVGLEEGSKKGKDNEDDTEELELVLRPPIKRNTSIQSELVKDIEDVVVLTPEEQAILQHHQRKFHASHTFYRFHETATHRAFPLDLMIVIVCLLDCHSLLQAALGGCKSSDQSLFSATWHLIF